MTDPTTHVSRPAGQTAPTEAPVPPAKAAFGLRHRRNFIIVTIIGFLMAVLAPLQTHFISFWPRLAFWEILMLSGATIGIGVTEAIEAWGRLRAKPYLEAPVIGVLIALPLNMIVVGAGQIFFGATNIGLLQFLTYFAFTALISIAVTALNLVVTRRSDVAPEVPPIFAPIDGTDGKHPGMADETPKLVQNQASTLPVAGPLLAERLAPAAREIGIIALQAEDHYLRVHFMGGQSELVLMRLSDAMAELPPDKGSQTHRSWWVARHADRCVTRSDGRATLSVGDDLTVPVSRSFYKKLQQEGWFA